jgi:hypothetical protein
MAVYAIDIGGRCLKEAQLAEGSRDSRRCDVAKPEAS